MYHKAKFFLLCSPTSRFASGHHLLGAPWGLLNVRHVRRFNTLLAFDADGSGATSDF
jgi:hypothetical protein